jgi:hypothetical protein
MIGKPICAPNCAPTFSRFCKCLYLLVGPAGLRQTQDINGLKKTETAGSPDISLCLSQRRVSVMGVRHARAA